MSLFNDYLKEIESRKNTGLHPKPIDNANLAREVIEIIENGDAPERDRALKFLIYNTLPGTTTAAKEKAEFLKQPPGPREFKLWKELRGSKNPQGSLKSVSPT